MNQGPRLKTIFMGTPDFAVPALAALARVSDVQAVYTQPDRGVGRGRKLRPTPVKQWALDHGIEVRQPEKVSNSEALSVLRADQPDLIVVAAYAQLLSQAVLDVPRLGCINVHSSLLPRWRGAAPIQHSILAGDAESGVTIMRMVKKLDAGDMLLKKAVPIGPETTGGSLHDELAAIGGQLIEEVVPLLASGEIQDEVQDESKATYASKLEKTMERLDPHRPASELDRQIRALTPWPGSSVRVKEFGRLKVLKARLSEQNVPLGRIELRLGKVYLGCGEGSLELERLQWDGKKPVPVNEWLNGLKGRGIELPLVLEIEEERES